MIRMTDKMTLKESISILWYASCVDRRAAECWEVIDLPHNVREAARQARRAGWRLGENGWVCPECGKARGEENDAWRP